MTNTRACLLALAVAACGVDVETSPHERSQVAATASPAPPDPFLTCAWHGLPTPNQNIAFTGYGYWGDQRGFRIHYGNYDSAGDYLEYKIEVIWSLPGCSGTVYFLRFPNHGLADHAEIEVRGAAQALKGRLVASEGSLPVLYNQNGTALPTHKLGPFVIKSNMVGGGSGMGDTIAFTLLDAQILTRLPYPVFYNGAAPTTQLQNDAIAAAHGLLVADNAYLFTLFAFRMQLDAMTSTDRQTTSDNIDIVINQPGPIHNTDLLWNEAHHVDHSAATTTAAIGVGFGGFWNGHRNLLGTVEDYLLDEPSVPAFGRVPAWDPALSTPSELAIGIDPPRYVPVPGSLTGGNDLELAYQAQNICTNFASSLSASPTLAQRLTDEEVALWNDVRPWHDSVHTTTVRGDLDPISYSASVPLFYPWHTAVDTIWRNWQLCEAAYHPNRYSWDAL